MVSMVSQKQDSVHLSSDDSDSSSDIDTDSEEDIIIQ